MEVSKRGEEKEGGGGKKQRERERESDSEYILNGTLNAK